MGFHILLLVVCSLGGGHLGVLALDVKLADGARVSFAEYERRSTDVQKVARGDVGIPSARGAALESAAVALDRAHRGHRNIVHEQNSFAEYERRSTDVQKVARGEAAIPSARGAALESGAVALDRAHGGHRNSIHEQDVLALREAQVGLRREQLKGAQLAEENEELRKEVERLKEDNEELTMQVQRWRTTARHTVERDQQVSKYVKKMLT